MKKSSKRLGILAVSTSMVLAVSGCVSYEGQEARDAHTDEFLKTLAERRAVLAQQPLSITSAVEMAMTSNYEVVFADLEGQMAKLGKDVAFYQFLPQVSAGTTWIGWDKQPMMQDKNSTSANLSIGLPLLMPSVWFMYASQDEKVAQSVAREHYVRQSICLKTMQAFYNCLVAEDTVKVVEKQVAMAKETFERVSGLAKEGLARDWEATQAKAQLVAREAAYAQAKRNALNTKGTLLNMLGLPPDYAAESLVLAREDEADHTSTNSVEALVLTALSIHPELEIADRNVIIQENEVRKAISDFLPTLSSFGRMTWTSDANSWTANRSWGLEGAWNVFSGFKNTAMYKLSKLERYQSELAREQTFLRIMLDVMVSRHNIDDARESAEVLAKVYEASSLKSEDYTARQKEGLIPLSDALDAEADASEAELQLLQSRYQERIAWVALKLAMGTLEVPVIDEPESNEE